MGIYSPKLSYVLTMTKMVLYLYVCWTHTFGLSCGSRNATSSCRGDWSVLSRKAEGAGGGQEDHVNVGAGMVVRRKTTAVGALLNIYNKRATNRRRKCISELSANASRSFRRDSRKHYTSNRETGHKVSLCSTTWT